MYNIGQKSSYTFQNTRKKVSEMKKILAVILAAILCAAVCSCGKGEVKEDAAVNGTEGAESENVVEEVPEEEEEKTVTSTENVIINGIYVDDSYVEEEGSPLKLVYMILTLTATDTDLDIDSNYCKMTINETNLYESVIIPDVLNFSDKYYYSKYLEDVYVGSSRDVLMTFKIPEGTLVPGKTVTISDSQIPGCEKLLLSTDMFEHFDSKEAVNMKLDEEAYTAFMAKYEPADEETVAKVKSEINGYQWSFYYYTNMKLEFSAPNKFSMTALGNTNSGTYEVLNGFISGTYDSGIVVNIPYSFNEAGEIELDLNVFTGTVSY